MRITKNFKDTTSMKQTLFKDLTQECALAAPGSRLSGKLQKKIGKKQDQIVPVDTNGPIVYFIEGRSPSRHKQRFCI